MGGRGGFRVGSGIRTRVGLSQSGSETEFGKMKLLMY
jgi:hypothetical protein